MISTVERARGRWREILPLIGVETRFLRNIHGPCPLCGGKDRYRFDDRNGAGTFFCNGCGAGSGFDLVARKLKLPDFAATAAKVDELLGKIGRAGPARSTIYRPKVVDALSAENRLRSTLRRAREPEVVEAYLTARGIIARSAALRGDTGAAFYDTACGRLIGYFAAVLAPIVDLDLNLRSVQVIFADPAAPTRKKTLPAIGTINGASIHLFPAGQELALTEGVENGLAFHEMFGLPVWAAVSAVGIETFEPPPALRRLVIAGDTDASFTGQAASYVLAKRLRHARPEIEIEVRLPPEAGVDWNDLLRAQRP